ncbi:MAG: hypothetical protein NC037_01930 [Bacteroides sp.]|nr:hypothetical protein [Bacillota bacterium]MCM1394216.1 hypothetical protein [[Eubacterium] siraeum]MCM1455274.1 hypothetical protein [Bacteroides sp.]
MQETKKFDWIKKFQSMEKAQRIRWIYAVFIALFTVAIGIAIICEAADIYYSGKGSGVIYSREIVGARLEKLAIPLIIYLVAVIAGVIFPIHEVKADNLSEETVKKLRERMPASGEGEEYATAQKAYKKYVWIRNGAWLFAILFALACGIASLCYVANTAHFSGDDISAEILNMVRLVLPLTLVSLVLLAAASIVNGVIAKRQVKEMKTLIRLGEGEKEESVAETALNEVKTVTRHRATVWTVRGVVLAIGVVFVIAGALNGGAHDVLIKAINICTECIGLG